MLFHKEDIVEVVPEIGLRLRQEAASTKATILARLTKGTKLKIKSDAFSAFGENHLWYVVQVLDGPHAGATGYAAAGEDDGDEVYLKKVDDMPPPPPPPAKKWKVGLHVLGHNPDEQAARDIVISCAARGKPVPIVNVVSHPELLNEIKLLSRETICLSRFADEHDRHPSDADFDYDAEKWVSTFVRALQPSFGIADATIWTNENLPGLPADPTAQELRDYVNVIEKYCQFFSDLAKLVKQLGLGRATMWDLGLASPATEHPEVLKLMRQSVQETCVGVDNWLNAHVYSPPTAYEADGNESMHVKEQWYAMKAINAFHDTAGLTIVGGEAGLGDAIYLGHESFVKTAKECRDMIAPFPNVAGLCLWTWGHYDDVWKQSELSPESQTMIELIVNG